MIKYTFLAVLVWAAGLFLDGAHFNADYGMVKTFVAENGISLFIYCTLAAIGLVGLSFAMRLLNFYGLMYVFSRLLLELSQLAIAFLSVGALLVWFKLQQNLWLDSGIAIAVPFEVLAAACMCIHLFDFNIPLLRQFIGIVSVPILTIIIIIASALAGFPGN